MFASWKTKLRSWLIDLVREAIRIERTDSNLSVILPDLENIRTATPYPGRVFSGVTKEAWDSTNRPTANHQSIQAEKSFEQIQVESIAEQVKYYEPKQL